MTEKDRGRLSVSLVRQRAVPCLSTAPFPLSLRSVPGEGGVRGGNDGLRNSECVPSPRIPGDCVPSLRRAGRKPAKRVRDFSLSL